MNLDNYRIRVVAAVIERDHRVLICQRKAGKRHSLKWEFPGGKVEHGESPREAISRELEEELAIAAVPGYEIARYEHHSHGRRPILLIFFHVREFKGEPANLEFEQILWEEREKLPEYDFLDGDKDFVQRLARGEC